MTFTNLVKGRIADSPHSSVGWRLRNKRGRGPRGWDLNGQLKSPLCPPPRPLSPPPGVKIICAHNKCTFNTEIRCCQLCACDKYKGIPWFFDVIWFGSTPHPPYQLSWTYNFFEDPGHNLESSQTWGFCMDFLNHREGGVVLYEFFLLSPLQCTATHYRNCKRLRKFEEKDISMQSCRGDSD